jgi:restriction endonuclease S subunit
LQTDEEQVRVEYATILDSIEQFNARLAANFERLERLKRALEGRDKGEGGRLGASSSLKKFKENEKN